MGILTNFIVPFSTLGCLYLFVFFQICAFIVISYIPIMHNKSNKFPFHIGLVIKPVLTVLQNLSYSVIVIVGFMYSFVNRLGM